MAPPVQHATLERDTPPAKRADADDNLLSAEGMLRGVVISALLWAMLLLLLV